MANRNTEWQATRCARIRKDEHHSFYVHGCTSIHPTHRGKLFHFGFYFVSVGLRMRFFFPTHFDLVWLYLMWRMRCIERTTWNRKKSANEKNISWKTRESRNKKPEIRLQNHKPIHSIEMWMQSFNKCLNFILTWRNAIAIIILRKKKCIDFPPMYLHMITAIEIRNTLELSWNTHIIRCVHRVLALALAFIFQ